MSLDDSVAFLTEREQATRDEAADAQWEREQRASRATGTDDFFEELTDAEKEKLNLYVDMATHEAADAALMLLGRAKQRVIARRVAEGK